MYGVDRICCLHHLLALHFLSFPVAMTIFDGSGYNIVFAVSEPKANLINDFQNGLDSKVYQ
jgi:hypothetical protein